MKWQMWPMLAAALLAGLIIGFAGGYLLGLAE